MKPPVVYALAAAMALASAHVGATATARVVVTPQFGVPFEGVDSGNGPVQVSGSASDGAGSEGNASAFADHGVIKLEGFATGAMRSSSVGSFGDVVTITSPEATNGTSGTFQVSIAVDGLLATSGGLVTWIAKVEYSTSSALLSSAIQVDGLQTVTGYIGDSFGLHVGTVPFVYGKPLLIAAVLNGTAETFVSGFEASFDLSRSFYWNGITNVTANGLSVSSYSILASSGTDYRQSFAPPVPEPSSALLLVPGIALLWIQRRFARRRNTRSARAAQPWACG